MKHASPCFYTWLPVAAAMLCVAGAAHAADNFIERIFTFREDQKAAIAPNKVKAPKIVQQPYYPAQQHEAWSNFYTRQDLEPEDYLSSSASKVMRAPQPAPRSPLPPMGTTGGWPAIAEQAAENARAEADATGSSAGVMIGDPGEGWGVQQSQSQVGRATEIGSPRNDWRGGTENGPLRSRPGDYDYKSPVNVADAGVAIGTPGAKPVDEAAPQPESLKNDPRYVGFNAKGQVTRYAVQQGDTLGGISSQPAIYNTWKLWPLIYSANRKAIGKNPHNLEIDQRLTIPRNYSDKQAREAERKSGAR